MLATSVQGVHTCTAEVTASFVHSMLTCVLLLLLLPLRRTTLLMLKWQCCFAPARALVGSYKCMWYVVVHSMLHVFFITCSCTP